MLLNLTLKMQRHKEKQRVGVNFYYIIMEKIIHAKAFGNHYKSELI